MILSAVLFLIFGLVFLCGGAELLVRGGVRIAAACGVSPLVVGLTLVAFATSAPELAVSVEASLQGMGAVSVGNVVGSNICNIGLILGVTLLIMPLPVDRQLLRFDLPVLAGASLLLAGVGVGLGGIGRPIGLVFLAALIAYTVRNVVVSRRSNAAAAPEAEGVPGPRRDFRFWSVAILQVLIGLAGLAGGGKLFCEGAIGIGRVCGLSDAVIGLTVVALGTSMPELATSVVAAIRRQTDIAIGNVVGSNIFNILGIMGIAPLIRPISSAGITRLDWGVLVVFALLLWGMMRHRYHLGRLKGGVLFAGYIAYTAYLVVKAQ